MPRYFMHAVSIRSAFVEMLRCVFRQLLLKTCRVQGCLSVAISCTLVCYVGRLTNRVFCLAQAVALLSCTQLML